MQQGGFILHDHTLALFNTEPYREQDDNYQLRRNMYLFHRILTMDGIQSTLLSDSSLYGYILKVDLPHDLPYHSHLAYEYIPGCPQGIHNHDCYRPIRSYVIKLVCIGPHDTPMPGTAKYYNGRAEFINECNTQYDLYNSKFLNGLYCIPPMFLREPLFLRETTAIMEGFTNIVLSTFQNVVNIRPIFQQLGPENDIGLVIMGFTEGYTTLYKAIQQYPHRPNVQRHLRLLGKFINILFTTLYGFYHGDHHQNNIMVNLEYDSPHEWYNGIRKGRAMVIDFGRAVQMPAEDYQELTENFNRLDYTRLLQSIHTEGMPSYVHNHHVYQWFITPEESMNGRIERDVLYDMLTNYEAFQNTPPNNQYKDISVTDMIRNFIFPPPAPGAIQPHNLQVRGQGGYKRKKSRKNRKSRNKLRSSHKRY